MGREVVLVVHRLELYRSEVVDLLCDPPIPIDPGGFADPDFSRDLSQRVPLGPQLHKTRFRLVVFLSRYVFEENDTG